MTESVAEAEEDSWEAELSVSAAVVSGASVCSVDAAVVSAVSPVSFFQAEREKISTAVSKMQISFFIII